MLLLAVAKASFASILPTNLTCMYGNNPLGVDVQHPDLSWIDISDDNAARNQKQSAYEILVYSGRSEFNQSSSVLWSTGKVISSSSRQILYSGKELTTAEQVYWKVRIWDQKGHVSPWSPASTWTTGVMQPQDWHAAWITSNSAYDSGSSLIGYHAGETTSPTDTKWVGVDLGKPTSISSIELDPMQHDGVDGFGFPLRFKIEASEDPDYAAAATLVDRTDADFVNPGNSAVVFHFQAITARYVRIVATSLWLYNGEYRFALHRLKVFSNGTNVAAGVPVAYKDSVENYGWGGAALTSNDTSSDSTLMRSNVVEKPGLFRAIAYVCGLGQYEMTVNGSNVTKNLLTPGWTKYDKTCLYDSYDVTRFMKSGVNSIGLLLGNGPYNVHGGRYAKFTGSFGPQKAICQIELQYRDGRTQVVGTDGSWKFLPGPITFSDMYGGEDYDARLLPAGWNLPSFDDSQWQNVTVVSGPGGLLKGLSCSAPPVVVTDVLTPAQINKLSPTSSVYDLGQNASVMPLLSVSGPAGSTVTITPAELVNADGTVDRESVGGGSAYWKYTLAGTGTESYFPKFFYQGCRFLQVDLTTPVGAPLPVVRSLVGDVISTSSNSVGTFECSNELFDKTYRLIRWAQRNNFMSIITDCPTRERLGWLEEDHLNGPSMRYNFDLDQLLNKIENDMADSQTPDGLIPDIAPEWPVFGDGFRDSPEWGSAFLLIPWQQYQFTGDFGPLRRNYPAIKRYVDYLTSKATDHILNYGLGDWYDIGPNPPGYSQLTPPALTATAFYYEDATIVARAAKFLGEDADAEKYSSLAASIKKSFISQFWNPASGTFSTDSETANALPYVMGLLPDDPQSSVIAAIVADIRSRNMSFTSGDIGYRYLLKALAESGRSDIIYAMNNQSDRPGYGYQLKMGATSLTEAWDAQRSSSQDHFMLGQINEWFFHDLAGIQDDPSSPGFSKIIIKPTPVGDLTSVNAGYNSVVGQISSDWVTDSWNVPTLCEYSSQCSCDGLRTDG